MQRWINIEKNREVMAAEDVGVLEETHAEFDDSDLLSSNERDQESCSDTSLMTKICCLIHNRHSMTMMP